MLKTHAANRNSAGSTTPQESRSATLADEYHLLLVDAETVAQLRGPLTLLIDRLRAGGPGELRELATALYRELDDRPARAGVVAASAGQAVERLATLLDRIRDDGAPIIDGNNGVFAGRAGDAPAIGYVFSGQGSSVGVGGDALTTRFEAAREFYRTVAIPSAADDQEALGATQPRIVASCIAGVRVLADLGIRATAAGGHSLGELTALHWAGALDLADVLALAAVHGRILTDESVGEGTMAVVVATQERVGPLLRGELVFLAGYNNPNQTVIAGRTDAVTRVLARASAAGLKAAKLPVAGPFHTPLMAPAAAQLHEHLAGTRLRPLLRTVVSTVTGDVLAPEVDQRELLVAQLCAPVQFSQAVERITQRVSLLLEVGPGRLLSMHASQINPTVPVIPLCTEDESMSGVLCAAGAAYVLGAPVRPERLVAGSAAHQKEA